MDEAVVSVGILLAAGQSRRFGTKDKLLVPFRGKPLAVHAAEAMKLAGLDDCIAVVNNDNVADLFPDFRLARVSSSAQSESLRAGLALARELGAQKIVVMLADMPFLTAEIVRSVVSKCSEFSASATTGGRKRSSLACFPEIMFDRLGKLSGDHGASTVLNALSADALVTVEPEYLIDIDRPLDMTP